MKKINIIYLLPEMKGASGGAKVIYNHSFKFNNIIKDTKSSVIHLKKKVSNKIKTSLSKRFNIFRYKHSGWSPKDMKISKDFRPNKIWFEKKVNIKKDFFFNVNEDFVIIPEIWSHFAVDLEFKKKKIKYGILIQGFFHMNSTSNYEKLKLSYEQASYILISSKYSLDCFQKMFPNLKNKIIKINLSINFKKFKNQKKQNIITYMPRKLPNHSLLLMFYLKNIIPKNWKILSLENISEKLLIEKLSKSKIFLSFSNFEGLGLPPIEAAISGNKVIGYDGGGGVEYWKKPIFIKIENGDIKNFGKKTLLEIKNYQKNWVQTTKKFRTQLINQYSDKRENKSLVVLRNKIQKLFK